MVVRTVFRSAVSVYSAAGMFAIRQERDYVMEEDFMKAARKISDVKKLEGMTSLCTDAVGVVSLS